MVQPPPVSSLTDSLLPVTTRCLSVATSPFRAGSCRQGRLRPVRAELAGALHSSQKRRAPRKAQHDKCFVRSAVDADPANMLEIGARPAEFEPVRARDAIDHDLGCTLVEDEIGVGDERVDAKDFGVDERMAAGLADDVGLECGVVEMRVNLP